MKNFSTTTRCNSRPFLKYPVTILSLVHGENDFAEGSKNFAGYRSKNNFIEPSK